MAVTQKRSEHSDSCGPAINQKTGDSPQASRMIQVSLRVIPATGKVEHILGQCKLVS